MSETDRRFHEAWLGMVQPIDGLVVSVPVLEDAQCMARQPPETRNRLREICPEQDDGTRAIRDLGVLFADVLGLSPEIRRVTKRAVIAGLAAYARRSSSRGSPSVSGPRLKTRVSRSHTSPKPTSTATR